MRIAVCDDDNADLSVTKEHIARFDADLVCDSFNSGEELLRAFDTTFYDLIFLDIEMDGANGYDVAKQLMSYREKPLIVFVTKSSKYTIQGYEVAFRYLVKPVIFEEIEKVLKAVIEQIAPRKIAIDIGGKYFIFSVKDIYYFETFGHNVKITTENYVYECRNTLKNIEDMLGGSSFIRPHNSYLVNMDYMVNASQTEIIMKDGRKIGISRNRKDGVFIVLHQYLRK